ncbi:hypothetical protein SESBI_21561 [Sesbania bispinosa]|nr:hypothetical protein SESBI_21561 [Sesbania bispinosa]
MAAGYDLIKSLYPGRQNWRLKVRVVRVWDMSPVDQPSQPFAIEMVLIDSEGNRIQASIRKPMIRRFRGVVEEGQIYRMSYFGIVKNTGSFRAAHHEYKLLFHGRTRVIPCEGLSMPLHGLSLMKTDAIYQTDGQSEYLVDMIGLLTAVSTEKLSVRDGRTTRHIVMELTDDKGKIQCTMFGHYVDLIKESLDSSGEQIPVVIAQFVRVKKYKGCVVLQNVMNTSRVIWSPQIPEAVEFKDRMIACGFDETDTIGVVDDSHKEVSLNDDFLAMFPRKTISELHSTEEEGSFVVLATIAAVLIDDTWWYKACKCMKAVGDADGKPFCQSCCMTVDNITPRYKLRVETFDGGDTAAFILFDSDSRFLLGKPCSHFVSPSEDPKFSEYPEEFNELVGLELLFKVEKLSDYAFSFDDSFKVKRVCDDVAIIEKFKEGGLARTPELAKFVPLFPTMDSSSSDLNCARNVNEIVDLAADASEATVCLDDKGCGSVQTRTGQKVLTEEASGGKKRGGKLRKIKLEDA